MSNIARHTIWEDDVCCDRHAMNPKDPNPCAIWLNADTYDGCEVCEE